MMIEGNAILAGITENEWNVFQQGDRQAVLMIPAIKAF